MRIWNDFKRYSRIGDNYEASSKGEFYFYILGWCIISLVIGFLLLPPTSITTTRLTKYDNFRNPSLQTWISSLSVPKNSKLLANKVKSSKLFTSNSPSVKPSILSSQSDRKKKFNQSSNVLPPNPEDILSPIQFPMVPVDALNTTSTGLTYHPDGRLLLNFPASSPLETHPIMTLIERGKIEWESKVKRQSKTLKEAVVEYKRRYGRKPPAGFDRWFAFAKENKVILVDEYDQISRDLYPFWALPPDELRSRAESIDLKHTRTFKLNFQNGTITRESELERASALVDLCSMFNDHYNTAKLPPITILMEEDDSAQVLLGWDQSRRLFELSRSKQFLPKEYKVQNDRHLKGWDANCPPTSTIRTKSNQTIPNNHSWIYHHRRAMDICNTDPKRIDLHGVTATAPPGPRPLVPLFAFSKNSLHADILVTPLEQYLSHYPGEEIPWAKRPYNKLYWRGSTTGTDFSDRNPKWRTSQRMRLYEHTHQKTNHSKILVGGTNQTDPVTEIEIERSILNEKYFNITFVNKPIQCDEPVCSQMAKLINFVPRVKPEDVLEYKYVLDVDGNGWSGRFHRLLSGKHLVIKSTIFPEWYTDRIQAWYHYVPSKIDYQDLYDITSFFIDGQDHLAERIATQGQQWAKDSWRKEDMAAYMFRLILEWNRIYHRNQDGSSNDFDLE